VCADVGESDQWAELVGDRRWSWDGLLPYFKKTETFYPAKSNTADLEKYHGFDGPIKVCALSFVAAVLLERKY
jgi:choline dehydrogenase-like flavoprotein